jgi:23S rRNA (uracil-5-)-methyltransferase RumA
MSVTPRCPVFGKCGGCSYQDKEYSAQLVIKRQETEQAFSRTGVAIPGSSDMKFFFKNEYFYRNRMDFVFTPDGLGLREKGKFSKLINFEICYISNDVINRLLAEVNAWYRANKEKLEVFDVLKRKGTLRYAVTRGSFFSKDSSITFIMNKDSDKIPEHIAMIKEFAAGSSANNVLYGFVKYNTDVSAVNDCVVVKGSDCLEENLGGMKYLYHTQGFFQNNSLVTMDMIFYMKEKIKEKYDVLLDMFGGVGTFGIFFADLAGDAIVVDNNKMSAACAEKNIINNGKRNVQFKEMDAMEIDAVSPWLIGKKCIYILDPPRTGLHKKTIKFIRQMKPAKILYVSCNQARLAEDIKELEELYSFADFAVFDMFPQARHIESVATLELKGTQQA